MSGTQLVYGDGWEDIKVNIDIDLNHRLIKHKYCIKANSRINQSFDHDVGLFWW